MKVLTAARAAHNSLVADAEIAASDLQGIWNGIAMAVMPGEKADDAFEGYRGEVAMARYLEKRGGWNWDRATLEKALGR